MKKLYILLPLLLFLLFSCSRGNANEANDKIPYTDSLGRELYLEKNPTRVAALIGSFADIWTLAGGELCAAPEDAWEDFGLTLPDAVNIGGAHSPSIELLLASDPTLVLASSSTASNVEMREILGAAGIDIIYFDIDNFEGYLSMLDICTDLTGRKDLYEKYGLELLSEIQSVKGDYKNADIPESERTVLLLRASAGKVKAKGSSGTILGEMLSDMGCINIADSDRTLLENLSAEAIIAANPYHIFAVTMGNDTEAAKAALENMIKENPVLGELDAIKENRLHVMDKSLFNLKPNSRWAEAYRVLYETLTEK